MNHKPRYRVDARQSQIGVMGDGTTIHGGIVLRYTPKQNPLYNLGRVVMLRTCLKNQLEVPGTCK